MTRAPAAREFARRLKRALAGRTRRLWAGLRQAASRVRGDRATRLDGGVAAGTPVWVGGSGLDSDRGTDELPVQQALARVLQPGDVFYDVGANRGLFTLVGAQLVGPRGRVIAFEPVASNASAIRRQIERAGFSHAEVQEVAVAASDGPAELLLTRSHAGAVLAGSGIRPPDTVGQASVIAAALDTLVGAGAIPPPDVVKIDVEGAELAVLEGMTQIIESQRPAIVYEVDAAESTEALARRDSIRERLASMGYGVEALPDSYPGVAWTVLHDLALPHPEHSPRSRHKKGLR